MSSLAYRMKGRVVGVSISDAVDAPLLGLDAVAMDYLAAHLVQQLLAVGADIAYGGDLRPGGFTEVMGEAVFRYERRRTDGAVERRLHHYVAWPIPLTQADDPPHLLYPRVIERRALAIDGTGRTEQPSAADAQNPDTWAQGLTAMRSVMSDEISARVVVGGATRGFKGAMPGIHEEALLAAAANKPVYVLGGFGGAARQLLGLASPDGTTLDDEVVARGETLRTSGAENGLDEDEAALLSRTADPDLAVALVLTGLARLWPASTDRSL